MIRPGGQGRRWREPRVVAGDAWQRLAFGRIPIAAWSGYALPNRGRAVRHFLLMLLLLFSVPVHGGELGIADLTANDLEKLHGNIVSFGGRCGWTAEKPEDCTVVITPTRLFINEKSIKLSQLRETNTVFPYRFIKTAGKLRLRGPIAPFLYVDESGKFNAFAIGFMHQDCAISFLVSLNYVRIGGIISAQKAREEKSCLFSESINFDWDSNYR